MLDGNIDDIEEWSAMFDHMVGDTAKVPKVRPRNMRDISLTRMDIYTQRNSI